ncbi:hypothetical protein GCM10010964_39960 [Caldovatus sediminis]|uniref:Cytochrome-c oxidase n=1 Tax=Caldovatus sediminis TaxID=2041189 RepID=A0A8J3ECQ5_9PROT|nr:hypothetical protein [Caldovatus sediminis]GGG48599.1 hypothetical protein GCM10010964_39960 [Caldovatus sediminis]
MARIDIWFLLLAAVCLTAGVSMGIAMGILHDFSLAPVHAHANLVGWASLGLFGLTYRAWPGLRDGWSARLHFVLSAPAAVLFPLGIYLSIAQEQPMLAIVASFLWLGGVLTFLGKLARLALTTREEATEAAPAPVLPMPAE